MSIMNLLGRPQLVGSFQIQKRLMRGLAPFSMMAPRSLVLFAGAGTALGFSLGRSPSLRGKAHGLARRWIVRAEVCLRHAWLQLKLLHLGSTEPDGCAGACHIARAPPFASYIATSCFMPTLSSQAFFLACDTGSLCSRSSVTFCI
jgi:hypothetical protein